jgi:NTP pyrophosphatase (non-canonical NTP hydrolase)
MNLDEYQKGAARTLASRHDWVTSLTVLGLGLAGESGEVIEHLKKHVGHGHALDREKVGKELGDVLWYVAGLATSLGLSLDAIAARNLEKLRERYPEGFTSGASKGRTE